jgi:hypothetical protein
MHVHDLLGAGIVAKPKGRATSITVSGGRTIGKAKVSQTDRHGTCLWKEASMRRIALGLLALTLLVAASSDCFARGGGHGVDVGTVTAAAAPLITQHG